MKIFDQKGMMIIPSPVKEELRNREKAIAISQCFCPNGHNLINRRTVFSGNNGILLKAKKNEHEGLLALSPIFGDHSRITVDIDLEEGDIVQLYCPVCNAELPSYSNCDCGGEMRIMFTTPKLSFSDCIGVCNKLGCFKSTITAQNELLTYAVIDRL